MTLIKNLPDTAIVEPLFFQPEVYQFIDSPKQLIVEPMNVHSACDLNSRWHSRFPIIHWSNVVRNKRYICFQAHDGHVVYAVAIWSSPVAANRMAEGATALELRRMAIPEYAPRNTASFMLAQMRKWIFKEFDEITVLISYQDTEVHQGTIYKADNWHPAVTSKGVDWLQTGRKRSAPQSTAPKTRWEYKRK